MIARIDTASGARDAAIFGDQVGNLYAVDARNAERCSEDETGRLSNRPCHRLSGVPQRTHLCRARVGRGDDRRSAGLRVLSLSWKSGRGERHDREASVEDVHDPGRPVAHQDEQSGQADAGAVRRAYLTTPAIDERKNALYVGTGDNYSDPPSRMSDAFVAMDLDSGKILWSKQMTAADSVERRLRRLD